MLKIKYLKSFKQDFKRIKSRGLKLKHLETVVNLLTEEKPLPPKYRDHQLENSRNYQNVRECHISPDWLLVYRIEKDIHLLCLIRTGTHSDLFKK